MSEPIGDDGIGRPPSGSELVIVELVRQRRAAETEATALRNRLLALGFTREGLGRLVLEHRRKLKSDVKGSAA